MLPTSTFRTDIMIAVFHQDALAIGPRSFAVEIIMHVRCSKQAVFVVPLAPPDCDLKILEIPSDLKHT
jgi:hypothetical protein